MIVPRAFHTATLLSDGRVLVSGGFGSEDFTQSAEMYDKAEDSWTPAGSMLFGTMLHTGDATKRRDRDHLRRK